MVPSYGWPLTVPAPYSQGTENRRDETGGTGHSRWWELGQPMASAGCLGTPPRRIASRDPAASPRAPDNGRKVANLKHRHQVSTSCVDNFNGGLSLGRTAPEGCCGGGLPIAAKPQAPLQAFSNSDRTLLTLSTS